MSNITAALGRSQLRKVQDIIRMRRADAAYYLERLKREVPDCVVPEVPSDYYHVYQLFSVRVPERDSLMKSLEDEGIMSKIYFSPVHQSHFYQNELKYICTLPKTEEISGDILSLPFYPGITRREIDFVVDSMKGFYEVN